ncbi:hypothetical protein [Ornithinimicrobium cerasi]|uniref:hypothetical protein n=1 Tax=Ornithinimicrobium cerasi TaxID=2248773 RepID=UPI000F010130|nr:hypothetical protein [Ornithinimicrobium cerasi]
MSITPGEEPGPRTEEPLLAEEPLPPGGDNLARTVEEIDKKIRSRGPDEVEDADEAADAAEGDAEDADERSGDDGAGSDADAQQDPTSDEGADPEDPEAQGADEPGADGTG